MAEKVFCPYVHSVCDEGYINYHEERCAFWERSDEVCILVEMQRRILYAGDKLRVPILKPEDLGRED